MDLEPVIHSEVSQKNKYINAYTWKLEKWYWFTYDKGDRDNKEEEEEF